MDKYIHSSVEGTHLKDDNGKRHVGPTPPDTIPSDWISHDCSTDRPKGVGKRDMVGTVWYHAGFPPRLSPASRVYWQYVTRYRIITRAQQRKVWIIDNNIGLEVYWSKAKAQEIAETNGGILYTAKLKEVIE